MNPLVKFSLFAVCAAAMQAALAAPVTFSFSGVPDGPLGTEFRGTIVYETAAPFAGNFANGIAGYSDAVLSATVSVGSFNWTLGPQPTFLGGIDSPQLFVGNHNTVGDEVTFQFGLVGPNVSFNGGSLRPSYVILRFVGDASVLPSNAIPENPLVLNGFSQNQGGFVFQPLGSDGTPMNSVSTLAFADNLTVTVASPIPEPETYGLLLAGLGLLGFEARRRRSLLAKP